MRNLLSSSARACRRCTFVLAVSTLALHSSSVEAAIGWDGGGSSNWWFNPVNWSFATADNVSLPTPAPISSGDAVINVGTNPAWDLTGEGVVFDPVNDPFYGAAATNPNYAPGFDRDKLYRLYISRNTTNTNKLTFKSGTLTVINDPNSTSTATIIIGRSGSTATTQNLGLFIQTGGTFDIQTRPLDIGAREAPTAENPANWGNGTYDYRGGNLLVQQVSGTGGIRLSTGSATTTTGGTGKFIMHNPGPAAGGRVKTFDFLFGQEGTNGDGIQTGVAIAEFHFENGGTRPIQIDRNLTINNGLDADSIGIRSARLDLKLDAAPSTLAGVPQNLGLFDVDFGGIGLNGVINGTGDLDNDANFTNDRVFSNIGNTAAYREGDTVSAIFGSTKYNWTISYTGNITWTDPTTSAVDQITGATTGKDVVLIGLSTETVALPDSADFNGDLKVDGLDFLAWQRGLGGNTFAQGDANHNGVVDNTDLTIWKAKYGLPVAVAAAGAVPEPASATIACLAALSLAAFRRRK
jgi:hypothetical protein